MAADNITTTATATTNTDSLTTKLENSDQTTNTTSTGTNESPSTQKLIISTTVNIQETEVQTTSSLDISTSDPASETITAIDLEDASINPTEMTNVTDFETEIPTDINQTNFTSTENAETTKVLGNSQNSDSTDTITNSGVINSSGTSSSKEDITPQPMHEEGDDVKDVQVFVFIFLFITLIMIIES